VSALGLVVALALGGGELDSLAAVRLQGLSFKAPAAWARQAPDANSLEWTAPEEVARLAVSVFPTEKFLPPAGCLKKMVEAVGKEGFTTLTIGANPAAKKVTSDFVGEGEGARVEANRVTTTTVLGCNGRLKWLLTFSARTAAGARLGPVYKRIIDSVSYGR
jgi:hypothetical protein